MPPAAVSCGPADEIPDLCMYSGRADAFSLAFADARAIAREYLDHQVPPVGYEPTLGPF